MLSWGFSRQFFENAVELRKRLEPDGKRDLADSKIATVQELARFFESDARDIIDKVNAGHLFKLLAQVSCIDPNRLGHLRKREMFVRVLFNKSPRFPDVCRLGLVTLPAEITKPRKSSFGYIL